MLVTVMVLLLLVTILVFGSMESRGVGVRIMGLAEERERLFQASESLIAATLSDPMALSRVLAHRDRSEDLPLEPAFRDTFSSNLRAEGTLTFRTHAIATGTDAVIGGGNLRALHFVIAARAAAARGRLESHHVQGVRRLAPATP